MEIIDDHTGNDFKTENQPDSEKKNRPGHHYDYDNLNNKAVIGIVFVVIGLLLVIRNMDIMPYYFENIIFSWPMILVAVGLVLAVGSKERLAGYIVMGVGGFFLLPYIFNESFNIYRLFWPAVFVVIGVVLITTRYGKSSDEENKDLPGDDFFDISNVLSGTNKRVHSNAFRGGKISSVFASADIDLTQAQLAAGTNIIEITCIFGGVTIIVPDDWYVILDVSPVLGGFTDSRKKSSLVVPDSSKQLIIKGTFLFAGGELK